MMYVHRSTSTQGNGTNEVSHTILYQLQRNNTRNVRTHGIYLEYVCTSERRLKQGKKRKSNKEENKRKKKGKKERERKKRNKKQTCAQGAGRVPRGQGCCLLVRSVLWYVQWMDQQKDATIRPDGRQCKKEESRDTAQTKQKRLSYSISSWWARDDPRDRKEGRVYEPKKHKQYQNGRNGHNNKTKLEHRVAQPTQSGRVRGASSTIGLTRNRATQQT